MKSEKSYLSKRLLVRKSTLAVKKAAEESMEIMGFVVVAEKGWVLKKFKDGRTERLSKLDTVSGPIPLD
jgi:hypothetical protein